MYSLLNHVFSLPLVTFPDAFAKVNLAQLTSWFQSGEYNKSGNIA